MQGANDSVFQQVQGTDWLRIASAPITPTDVLVWDLGAGESSVLAIAHHDPQCEAILDERDAGRCAQSLGIEIRGTLGLVILAKQIGSISSARGLVQELRQTGLFLSDFAANRALALVGE